MDAIHEIANVILIHLGKMFSGNQGIVPRHCIQCGLWLTSQEEWQLGCVICEGTWPDLRGRDRRAIDERKVCPGSHVDGVQVARECGFGTAGSRVEIPRKTTARFALGAVGGERQQCAHG